MYSLVAQRINTPGGARTSTAVGDVRIPDSGMLFCVVDFRALVHGFSLKAKKRKDLAVHWTPRHIRRIYCTREKETSRYSGTSQTPCWCTGISDYVNWQERSDMQCSPGHRAARPSLVTPVHMHYTPLTACCKDYSNVAWE